MKKVKKICGYLLAAAMLMTSIHIPQAGADVVQASEQTAAEYTYRRVENIVNAEASSWAENSSYGYFGPGEAFKYYKSKDETGRKWHTKYDGTGGGAAVGDIEYGLGENSEVPKTYQGLLDITTEGKVRVFIGGSFKEPVMLGKFGYLARHNSDLTWINQYALYVSTEENPTAEGYKLVSTGNFTKKSTTAPDVITLDSIVEGARHFKLVAISTHDNSGYVSASRVEMYEVISKSGYTNIASEAVISPESIAGSEHTSDKLVDKSCASNSLFQIYNGAVASDKTVTLTFNMSRKIDGYSIAFENKTGDGDSSHTYTYSIHGSADGVTWTPIAENKVATRASDWEHRYLKDTPDMFKYVRITVHNCVLSNGNNGWVSLAEFEVYGQSFEESYREHATVVHNMGSTPADDTSTSDEDETDKANMLDGNLDSTYILKPNNGNAINAGNYFGLVFDEVLNLKNVEFVFDKSAARDTVSGAKLQYLPSGMDSSVDSNWMDIVVDEEVIEWDDLTGALHASVILPTSVDVSGVRLYCTKAKSGLWFRINEIKINQESVVADYESSDVEYLNLTATAGSYTDPAYNDGPAGFVLDGNKNLSWHTHYNGTEYANIWLDLEMSYEMIVDGLRVWYGGHNNGNIQEYKVAVSSDGTNYTTVCEGTWDDTKENCWKNIKFEPIRAKHVRLFVLRSLSEKAGNYGCINEIRVTKATEESDVFTGGALRMDLPYDYTQTFLRFMYEIPQTFGGMTLDEEGSKWGWRYSVVSAADVENMTVVPVNPEKYSFANGTYSSNLLFKNIKKTNFARPIYTQLVVNYKKDGETLRVYSTVEERSVQQVAKAIIEDYTGVAGKEAQVIYANGIMKCGAQLATGVAKFDGKIIDLSDCLYTFSKSDSKYVISGVLSDGKTPVYLKTGLDNQIANSIESELITVHEVAAEEKFKFQGSRFLHFYDNDLNKLHFDRCQNDGCSGHKFEIYKLGGSEESAIRGYTKIKSLEELDQGIEAGSKFLITIQADDKNYYVLHPAITNQNFDHVAKVIQ